MVFLQVVLLFTRFTAARGPIAKGCARGMPTGIRGFKLLEISAVVIRNDESINRSMILLILKDARMRGAAEPNCERGEHLRSANKLQDVLLPSPNDASPNPECVPRLQGSKSRIFPGDIRTPGLRIVDCGLRIAECTDL
jgi:hypothetical protein